VPVEAGVTVVLIVVVLVPADVPVCDEVLGTGCGAGTAPGEGIPEPFCCDDPGDTEVGGGTCESGGCGGTLCWEAELCAAAQVLSSKRTKIKRRRTRSFRRCIVSRLGINP